MEIYCFEKSKAERHTSLLKLGELTIEDHHDQDCCEDVYADWESIDLPDLFFTAFSIEFLPGSGFSLLLYPNSSNLKVFYRLFVPCYNSQNGYYSSDLSLIIRRNGELLNEVDITNCVLDCIY